MSFDRKKYVYLLRAGRNRGGGVKHPYDHWPDWKRENPIRACFHYSWTEDIQKFNPKDKKIKDNRDNFDHMSRLIGNNVIIIEPISEHNPKTAKIVFVGKTTSQRKLADPPMNFGEYGKNDKRGEHSNYVEVDDGHELKNKTPWEKYFAFREPKNKYFTCARYSWDEIRKENKWDELDSLYDL